MSPVYRTRRTPNSLVIVRGKTPESKRGYLAAVGLVGFHKPQLIHTAAWKKTLAARYILQHADKLLEAATQKAGGNAPWSYEDRLSTVKSQFTQAKVVTPNPKKPSARTVRLNVVPGTYGDNLRARDVLRNLPQSRVRGLFRRENKTRGQKGYAQTFSQLVGASGLLSIGGKFLVIPNRGHTRLYDGYYHVIGGIVETEKVNYPNHATKPAEQALREISEETGFDPKKLAFVGEKLRKTTSVSRAQALAVVRSIEKVDPSVDVVYALNYPTNNVQRFIRRYFRQIRPDEYVLVQKPKEDEAAHFAVIPRTVQGIEQFTGKNNRRITPALRIALEAMRQELEKNTRKRGLMRR